MDQTYDLVNTKMSIDLSCCHVQCLMSRNVNKIFFADLEILDLTNPTHCLGVLLSLNTRQSGHQKSPVASWILHLREGFKHFSKLSSVNLTHCPDLMFDVDKSPFF